MSFHGTVLRGMVVALGIGAIQAASGDARNRVDLAAAVRAGDIATVKAMMEKGGADPNVKDASGTPLLMTAVVYGNAESVRILLEHGADANAKNPAGATALLWAAGDWEKASLLIAHGADVNVQSALGRTPLLSAAAQDGAGPVVGMLLKKGASTAVVDKLTGPPNVPQGGGSGSAVIEAAKARSGEALKLLLANHLDVNFKGGNGSTALGEATILGNVENVRTLLKAGAKTDARVSSGRYTPLMLAAMRNDPQLVRMLIDAGSEVDARDVVGSTALMWAAYSERGNSAVVELLLKAGAEVNARNDKGETAMRWAKWNGETPIVALLRKWGAAEEAYPARASAGAARDAIPSTVRTAVEKGLAVLQPSGPEFFKKSGCVSCHHQGLPGMAVGLAKERGFRFDEKIADRELKNTMAFLRPAQELLLEGSDVVPEVPATGGYLLMGLAAQGYRADDTTTAVVHNIALRQRQDGAWTGWSSRPPISGGDIRETAVAIFALQHYGPAGRRAEFEGRVERAGRWLTQAKADTTEEQIVRVLGLAWANADAAEIRKSAAAVLAEQRPDGGWAQLTTRDSDAYATGEALFALRAAGALTGTSPEYERGIRYLLRTQEADGSWHVQTRAFPFQPLVESGFPHGRDQWISASGTSWALVALLGSARAGE